MIELNEIRPYGYGVFLYSPDVLTDFLKEKTCRAKKLLTYFDKNKNVFFESIKNGVALPIYRISVYSYPIFVFMNETYETIPQGWEQVYRYNDFFIQVGNSSKLCFAAFDYFEYHKDLIDKHQTDYSKEIPTGPDEILTTDHYAVGFDIPKGCYSFDLIGYKRSILLDESKRENYGRNYAYGVVFKPTNKKENTNLDKCDDEKHIFDIGHYLHDAQGGAYQG